MYVNRVINYQRINKAFKGPRQLKQRNSLKILEAAPIMVVT